MGNSSHFSIHFDKTENSIVPAREFSFANQKGISKSILLIHNNSIYGLMFISHLLTQN